MLKRTLCAALALLLLVCGLSMTVLAEETEALEETQVLHTLNSLRFPAALTIIGGEANTSYQYEDEENQDNDVIERAEYIPQDKTVIVGYVGFEDDKIDFYKVTLDHSCHMNFFGVSGTDGLNSTGFQLMDADGQELLTADYDGETDTDDYYSFQTTLAAGTYYICVTDDENWTTYTMAFILTPALDAPVVTGISNDAQSGKPVLTWDAVNGASGYEIHRADAGDDVFVHLGDTETASFTDTTAEPGEVYSYKLVAISGNAGMMNSMLSAETSAVCDLAKPVVSIDNDSETGKPVVSWENVEGAAGYDIYRSVSESSGYELLDTVAAETSYLDITAQVSIRYYYKVLAFHENSDANSAESEVVNRVCELGKPVVSVSNNDAGKPVVQWGSVESAQKYRVYRATSQTGSYSLVYTGTAAGSYTDKKATVSKTYYYKVRSVYENFTADSDIVSGTGILATPEVSISGDSDTGKPVIKWKTVSGASKYAVYRATAEDSAYEQVYTAVSARSYTDETAEAGIHYYYKVKAMHKKAVADSAESGVLDRLCALARPIVEASNSATGEPQIIWESVEGAAGYEVYRSSDKSGDYALTATVVDDTVYTDENTEFADSYYYKVKAVHENPDANSVDSALVNSVHTLAKAAVSISGDADTGKTVVQWESVEGAGKYRVYRSTSEKSGYSVVYTGTAAGSYTDKKATTGTRYYYKVKATFEEYSSESEVVSRVCALAKPIASIAVDSETGKPVIKWKTVTGASGYTVYRAAAEDGEYEQVCTETTAKSYTDDTAEAGITYFYKVQAIHKKDYADSEYSEAVSCLCTLAEPALTTGKTAEGKPVVSWEIQERASAYEVYRADTKSGSYELVATVMGEDSYTDETVEIGKTWYYKVKAVHENPAANSAQSAAVSCVCGLPSPEVGIGINPDTGKPVVQWGPVEGAANYRVYRSTSENEGYKLVYTATAAGSYTDKNAKAGTVYYYKVKAMHKASSASSEYSETVNCLCALAKPDASISANTGTGKPVVKWKTVTGASEYYVYRSIDEDCEYELVYTAVTARSYTDQKAEAGVSYCYMVQAAHKNPEANSECTEILEQICILEKPVVSITRKAGDPSLSWSEISGAEHYEVWRATSKTGTYTKVGTVTETGFTDSEVRAGRTYYYKVMAIHENPDANSEFSAVKYIAAK